MCLDEPFGRLSRNGKSFFVPCQSAVFRKLHLMEASIKWQLAVWECSSICQAVMQTARRPFH